MRGLVSGSLSLTACGWLLAAPSFAQPPAPDARTITLPSPPPLAVEGQATGATVVRTNPGTGVDLPPPAPSPASELRDEMPPPLVRQEPVPPAPAPGQAIPRVIPI